MVEIVGAKKIKSELTSTFIHMALTLHREGDSFTEEQLLVVSEAVLAFNDNDVVTGQVAEDVFHDNYQAEWKRQMKTNEDAQDWSGNIDWRPLRLPKVVIASVAMLAAIRDSVKTKAWYKHCRENP
jgi:acyl carrier protein phosphodiesterase